MKERKKKNKIFQNLYPTDIDLSFKRKKKSKKDSFLDRNIVRSFPPRAFDPRATKQFLCRRYDEVCGQSGALVRNVIFLESSLMIDRG